MSKPDIFARRRARQRGNGARHGDRWAGAADRDVEIPQELVEFARKLVEAGKLDATTGVDEVVDVHVDGRDVEPPETDALLDQRDTPA